MVTRVLSPASADRKSRLPTPTTATPLPSLLPMLAQPVRMGTPSIFLRLPSSNLPPLTQEWSQVRTSNSGTHEDID